MSRILVIDDDSALRLDISFAVCDWGHEVEVAKNANEGLRLIEEWQPDLVLCDIQMPKKTGYEMLNAMSCAGNRCADMAFLFISSLSARDMVIKGLEIGADDYIVKPIDYELLKVKIESHLRKIDSIQNYNGAESLLSGMRAGAAAALMFVSLGGVAGVVVFMVVYWVKSLLGINIFEDVHLSDLF